MSKLFLSNSRGLDMDVATADKSWDVIVIGAGMGGGVCGRALAEAGLSVLFVDRGDMGVREADNALESESEDASSRRLTGCWPARMHATVDGSYSTFFSPQGIGAGGTSVFYAASLERPERHDLEPTASMRHPTGGWPVGYDEFRPWFDRAQALMELDGTPDPLRPDGLPALRTPPPLSEACAAMVDRMRASGLHPYRTHLAIRRLPDCRECIGHKCPRACKLDGRSAGVEPALATGRAAFLGGVSVRALRGCANAITHIEVERDGDVSQLHARAYVLAAGALGSPHLLLASASKAWPQGCANESGLVGRGLMFHLSERFALWPPRGADTHGPRKTLSLRDFYSADGKRFGLVQSLGLSAGYGSIVQVLKDSYSRSFMRRFRPGREVLRIPARIAAKFLGEACLFVGILEDLPADSNRVFFDPASPDSFVIEYRLSPELVERRALFRRTIRARMNGLRMMFLNWSPELNLAHPCGTLRFSDDSTRGVLDRNCKAHGVDNLYVADSSFMPTSTGVNPSLLITANALRVADALAKRLLNDELCAAGGRDLSFDSGRQGHVTGPRGCDQPDVAAE